MSVCKQNYSDEVIGQKKNLRSENWAPTEKTADNSCMEKKFMAVTVLPFGWYYWIIGRMVSLARTKFLDLWVLKQP